jgi:hypothetical protein
LPLNHFLNNVIEDVLWKFRIWDWGFRIWFHSLILKPMILTSGIPIIN